MMFGQRFRPYAYKNVLGQKKVVTGLQTFIRDNNIPQSIGFIGSSGSGKSTLARLVCMSLNCTNPTNDKETGFIEPCCECPSCKSIINETYGRGVHVYNGSDINVESIKEIEEIITYNSMVDDNTIILIEESQLVKEMKRFLQIIEVPRKNVYWLLTSTDSDKFGNISYSKDNKSQEQKAMVSRLTRLTIQPITITDTKDYLFKILAEVDPEEKIPDEFIEEGLQVIAENSKGSLRLALNDMETALACECYSIDEVRNLLNYKDESKEYDQIYYMATKNPLAMQYIQESKEVEGNFRYWNKILSDIVLRDITNIPCNEPWKENSAKQIIATGNLQSLFEVFTKTHEQSSGYFNTNIFISNLYSFYRGDSKPKNRLVENNTNVPVKKIKVIKGE